MKYFASWMPVALALFASHAVAQPPKPPAKPVTNNMSLMQALTDGEIANEVGITEEQRVKVRTILRNNRQRLLEARRAGTKAEAELELALGGDQVDDARANTAIGALSAARSEATRVVAEITLQIRQALSAEQWRQLQILGRRRGRAMGIP